MVKVPAVVANCWKNEHNFCHRKATKTGFSQICKSCYDAHYGKKDVPDGHQRCKGECGQVLKLGKENFARNSRSGFRLKCRSCKNAEEKAKKDAVRSDKPKRQRRDRKKICPTAISDAWESAVEC